MCISKLATNPKLRDQLAQAGYEEVEKRFSVEEAARLLERGFMEEITQDFETF